MRDIGPTIGPWFVYFVRVGDFVKVGVTSNWGSRLETIRVHSPVEPEPLMLQQMPGKWEALDLEQKWLHHFEPERTRGEWFRACK